MTQEEWQKLYENYETTWLLDAVKSVDALRDHLNDGEYGQPPQIRIDLLKLHGLAMDVVNKGWQDDLGKMVELADNLEDQVEGMRESLEVVYQTLTRLTQLLPSDAFDFDD